MKKFVFWKYVLIGFGLRIVGRVEGRVRCSSGNREEVKVSILFCLVFWILIVRYYLGSDGKFYFGEIC